MKLQHTRLLLTNKLLGLSQSLKIKCTAAAVTVKEEEESRQTINKQPNKQSVVYIFVHNKLRYSSHKEQRN